MQLFTTLLSVAALAASVFAAPHRLKPGEVSTCTDDPAATDTAAAATISPAAAAAASPAAATTTPLTATTTTPPAAATTTPPAATTTTPPAATTATTATAAAAGGGGGGGLGGFLSGTQTGQGTWYEPGLGACGITNSDTDLIAAVSHILFDQVPGYDGVNPNSNPVCGHQITATYQGKSVTVTVTDRCTGCLETDLDFSPGAFQHLADMGIGRISDMTWTWS